MSARSFDAVVIGAGPGGSLAARELARRGRSVLLVDRQRFPRPKVCGCCLNRAALTTLEEVGLGGLIERLGAVPLERLDLFAGRRRASLALPRSVSLSRDALDMALIQAAAEQGVTFRGGVSAKVKMLGRDVREGHHVALGDGGSVTGRVVVVADGLGGSSLAGLPGIPGVPRIPRIPGVPGFEVVVDEESRIGFGGVVPADAVDVAEAAGHVTLPPDALSGPSQSLRARLEPPEVLPGGRLWMACGRSGYLGVVRLEDGSLDVAAAVDGRAIKKAGGVASAARQLLREAGVAEDVIPLERVKRWRVTPALTRRRQRLAAPGLFIVGDAAGYVEPFTGEGMAWAMAGGAAVAPLAAAAIEGWTDAQVRAWHATYHKRIAQRQAGCRVLAALLRRPRLMRLTVAALSICPGAARPLTRRIGAANHHRLMPPPFSQAT